jgi:hypothetical protein
LVTLNQKLAKKLAASLVFLLKMLLPLLPALMALVFWKKQYLTNYRTTLAKLKIHLTAISQGPVQHYFEDIFRFNPEVCEPVQGHCSQCGNCCLNRQCVFLQAADKDTYVCGIYSSPLRKFSNCSTFPLNGYDIERYQCPTFTVTGRQPVFKLQQI